MQASPKYSKEIWHEDKRIIVTPHAVERIAQRLGWSKQFYRATLTEICFKYWDQLVDPELVGFKFIYKGVEWRFEISNSQTIILKTVVEHNRKGLHKDIRNLIRYYNSLNPNDERKKSLYKRIQNLVNENPAIFFIERKKGVSERVKLHIPTLKFHTPM